MACETPPARERAKARSVLRRFAPTVCFVGRELHVQSELFFQIIVAPDALQRTAETGGSIRAGRASVVLRPTHRRAEASA